jgi:DNA-binding CsgD family transcriptional regulator
VRNRAISDQARLLGAVSELDASPAPATEVAAGRLAGVVGALIPGDIATVNLGDPRPFHDVEYVCGCSRALDARHNVELACGDWRPLDPRIHARMRFTETGVLITDRRSDAGSFRSLPPTIDYGCIRRPVGIENVVGAPIAFPGCGWLATHREAGDFSDGDILLLDQLRPVASRLLRRSTVSSLAEASASAWGLSPREAEVFAFAGVGLSIPSIASILGISVATVRTQMGKAYQKTAVRSRAAATSALLDVVEPTALREAGRRLVPGEGRLTRRETAVLRVAATGRTTSAIASVIGISTETAKTHLANAYRKLGVQNRSQALLLVGTGGLTVGASDPTVEGTRPLRRPAPTSPP